MTAPIDFRPTLPQVQTAQTQLTPQPQQGGTEEANDLRQRFEQMLWAEMLRHTGLEDALTKSGGQAASAFSQFVIESIAGDLAERHPLGLDPIPQASAAYETLLAEGQI
ncbi:hypothetical protein [Henriciella litoralis]|uniref:hypothetical protein n=1 Tax=Henriciella litoralis TaxID=568102 RepID=UPI000A047ACC|nr:hypothetical protein [Henriciella litoralis]